MSTPSTRRAIAVTATALIWVVAVLASLASLFSAYLGRANWGDGQPPDSLISTVVLLALAVLAPLVAVWVTRAVWRRIALSGGQ